MSDHERRASEGPDRRRVPRGGRRATDEPGRYPSIVVVDSYTGARVPCARYLDRFGFKVIEAATPGRAAAAIATAAPQVIITEADRPRLARSPVSEQFLADARTRGIPLIVMTTSLGDDAADHARYDAAAVLLKPFRLAQMLEEVRRVLRAQPPKA
jgi:DNA-binding NtrC family response regulator